MGEAELEADISVFDVAVKLVITFPPTLVGAVKATDTSESPATGTPIVGALGTFSGLYEAVMNPEGYRFDMGINL